MAIKQQVHELLLPDSGATHHPDAAAYTWSPGAAAAAPAAVAALAAGAETTAARADLAGAGTGAGVTDDPLVAPELYWQPGRASYILDRERGLLHGCAQKPLGRSSHFYLLQSKGLEINKLDLVSSGYEKAGYMVITAFNERV